MTTLKWEQDRFYILDQNELPEKTVYVRCENEDDVHTAIKTMKVRGAPAIGIAAAYGIVLAINNAPTSVSTEVLVSIGMKAIDLLATSRPTAVNLFWALEKMKKILIAPSKAMDKESLKNRLLHVAQGILDDDIQICKKIGEIGMSLLCDGDVILTHCNAGALATGGYGTALGVIYSAIAAGKKIRVYADETRPRLQGARLTCWELSQAGVEVTLIADSVAGYLMKQKKVSCVIVGADRIALNGDTANKIGTYSLSVLAKSHHIPFYIAAPTSTIDMVLLSGEEIPIEERDGSEVTTINKTRIAPSGVRTYNPAFDVTPAQFITGIITEKGIIDFPYEEKIRQIMNS
ncbi:S-methyl-5-thioribose-1-phosphate isomerase [Chlamydiota bacterium]